MSSVAVELDRRGPDQRSLRRQSVIARVRQWRPPKIILCVPIEDNEALAPFVEACLRDKVELIAVVGDGCKHVEDLIDAIVVGDGSDQSRFLITTAHHARSLDEATHLAENWACQDGRDGVLLVRL